MMRMHMRMRSNETTEKELKMAANMNGTGELEEKIDLRPLNTL